MTLLHARSVRVAVGALVFAAATVPAGAESRARYLMGTTCEITIDGAADATRQIDAAFAETARIENFLSTWRDDSELSMLNATHTGTPSAELRDLLLAAVEWSKRTNGAFNPLMRPLIDLWRTREEGEIPRSNAIARALDATRLANVRFEEGTVALTGGAEFEEGGFGKGYAIDRMLKTITAASAIVNFGGQLAVRGGAVVSVANPEHRDEPAVSFTISDASLSTSSGSEKTFVVGGTRFSHLIDPRTGQALPPRGSVSVVAGDALSADILSTALYVMGPDEGLRWADANGVAALFITGKHQLRRSRAFRERVRDFVILDRNFTAKD